MTRAGEQYVGPMVVLQDGPAAAKIAAKAAVLGIASEFVAIKSETAKTLIAFGRTRTGARSDLDPYRY